MVLKLFMILQKWGSRLNLKYKELDLRHISIENVGRDGILVYIIEQAEHSASHLVQ